MGQKIRVILAGLCLILAACATRTVYLQPSEAVMLAETIKGADCWVKLASGEIVKSKCTLFEGGFYMSLTDEELKELGLEELIDLKDPQSKKK